jgi:MoaA/NifB/PqqE/SkfB family radical SAM enzyme
VTKSMAKRLVDIGSDLWTTSIWAGTPQAYTATHPNQPEKTFCRLKEMLTYVSQYKKETKRGSPWIKIYNVISNKNYDDMVNMLHFAIEVGADDIQYVPLDPVEGRTECLLLDARQRDKVIEQLDIIKKNYDPRIRAIVDDKGKVIIHMTALDEYEYRIRSQGMEKGVYDLERIKRVPCYTGYLFARVMGNGNVVPCCKGYRKPMGNVNEKTFKAIWDGKRYQEFRVKGRSVFKNWDYFKDFECHKTCDNLWQNEPMYDRVKRLSAIERSALTIAQKAYLIRRSLRRRLR